MSRSKVLEGWFEGRIHSLYAKEKLILYPVSRFLIHVLLRFFILTLNAAELVTQQLLPPAFILNWFSAYQSQVCWKVSQKNLPIYWDFGGCEGEGISNSPCQELHLIQAIAVPTHTNNSSTALTASCRLFRALLSSENNKNTSCKYYVFKRNNSPRKLCFGKFFPKGLRLRFFCSCNSAQCSNFWGKKQL